MSRIGKLPIIIPSGVTTTIVDQEITVTGPKGELKYIFNPKITVVESEGALKIGRTVEDVESAELHGLSRTLINNMVLGVSTPFKKELEINGIGYRAAVSGKKLTLNLGYSHPIDYIAPEGINISVEKNVITVSGVDKQLVGQVSADIRAFRKPEPYKGKGIKYMTEHIRRKAGKTGSK
ncbi:MAG: 50S ribosomal protein L6 [bacterium]